MTEEEKRRTRICLNQLKESDAKICGYISRKVMRFPKVSYIESDQEDDLSDSDYSESEQSESEQSESEQ